MFVTERWPKRSASEQERRETASALAEAARAVINATENFIVIVVVGKVNERLGMNGGPKDNGMEKRGGCRY